MIKLINIVFFIFVVSSCSFLNVLDTNPMDDWVETQVSRQYIESEEKKIYDHVLGKSKEFVINYLGKPEYVDSYDGKDWWFYYFKKRFETHKAYFSIKIAFKNGVVVNY